MPVLASHTRRAYSYTHSLLNHTISSHTISPHSHSLVLNSLSSHASPSRSEELQIRSAFFFFVCRQQLFCKIFLRIDFVALGFDVIDVNARNYSIPFKGESLAYIFQQKAYEYMYIRITAFFISYFYDQNFYKKTTYRLRNIICANFSRKSFQTYAYC